MTSIKFNNSGYFDQELHDNGTIKHRIFDDGYEIFWDEKQRLHRTDGPAFISSNIKYKEYFLHGLQIEVSSDEEFIIKQLLE